MKSRAAPAQGIKEFTSYGADQSSNVRLLAKPFEKWLRDLRVQRKRQGIDGRPVERDDRLSPSLRNARLVSARCATDSRIVANAESPISSRCLSLPDSLTSSEALTFSTVPARLAHVRHLDDPTIDTTRQPQVPPLPEPRRRTPS